ncbi:hypothetical protein FS842_000039 [Serendipita sp. 407]|nr:hypothetical protein FRC15_007313 [Serendipita sp. 397]KAG8832764.1 hypothetical protein FRC20_007842 [Serendipita sp. 405]KAG9058842.1 hypothetical protein FS842_000039 [Serendipita sp. 407]
MLQTRSMEEGETTSYCEFFGESLDLLFDHPQVAITAPAGQQWTHERSGIRLEIPRTKDDSNWALQADAVWLASIYLSERLLEVTEGERFEGKTLELGCGAGLLGLAIATSHPHSRVVLSDYPDEGIIETLQRNVAGNHLGHRVKVAPLDWNDPGALHGERFDTIVAADSLWMSELHSPLCETLKMTMATHAKAHIIAGLHTGRLTIQRFLEAADKSGLTALKVIEYHSVSGEHRDWSPEREGERREVMNRWLVYIRLTVLSM